MTGLFINEWLKAWHGRKVWIFMVVMASFVLFSFVGALLINANFDLMITTEEFVSIGSLFSFFIMLYSFVLITGAISGESSSGTVKQLMIRPVSRHAILFSKWFGNLLLSLGLYLAVLLFTFGFGLFFAHVQPLSETALDTLLMALYMMPTLIFYLSLATFLAVVTKNTAVTIVLTFLPYFFADIFVVLTAQYEWTKWIVFAHIDVFGNYGPMSFYDPPFESMWSSVGFLGLHIAALLVLAHIIYKKQDMV